MHSCVYIGNLYHHRYLPRENKFRYTVFFMYLDPAELPHLFDGRWFWSIDRANIANFKRSDYLGPTNVPLDRAVRDRVENVLGDRPTGPIRMLTHLRYFGHCFNPVSFYYCFDAEDTKVEFIVAEITNTPWGERHAYVLGEKQNQGEGNRKRYQFGKKFHVSPFMDLDFWYDWRFDEPGDSLFIHMINTKGKTRFFEAQLSLERREMTGAALAWVLVRFPAMTVKILSMIYWQAFRLWLKKTPYYEHPKYQLEEKS
jgi:DUF1365 family protein